MKLAEALEVMFIAVDRYFEPDAGPAEGAALQVAMNYVVGTRSGMAGHTVCTGHICGCKLKLPSRKLDSKEKPSTLHVRRRQCHNASEAQGLTGPKLPT